MSEQGINSETEAIEVAQVYRPAKGDIVIALNAPAPGAEEAAVITRVWSETCVNLMVFADCGLPTTKTSVKVCASRDEANRYLATLPGHYPIVCFPHGA